MKVYQPAMPMPMEAAMPKGLPLPMHKKKKLVRALMEPETKQDFKAERGKEE